MRDNTPPHVSDIGSDEFEDEGEVILLENIPSPSDDEDDLVEITLQQLEERLGQTIENDDDERELLELSVVDEAAVTFKLHGQPVFGCSLHPNHPWAATGGEDDCVYVWHTGSGELLQKIGEHKDTVTDVHFSSDGSYLATGDMSGFIMVHKVQETDSNGEENTSKILRNVWEFAMGDMSWLWWHREAHVLFAGSENGEVYIWRMPLGDCKILPGAGARCVSASLAHDGKKLLAAYASSALKLWDLKSCSVLMEVNEQHPMGHQEGVTALACERNSPLYMSGGGDGKILFSTNNGPVGSVEANGYVECVAFSPCSDLKMAASATLNGQVAIWDFGKYSLRTLCEHAESDGGITTIKWLSAYTLLVATIQGNILAYDARTGLQKFKLSGHLAEVYNFSFNARESILLSSSEDYTAKIFKVPQLHD